MAAQPKKGKLCLRWRQAVSITWRIKMSNAPLQIPVNLLDAHPKNPRLVPREDVIETIAAHINGHGFDLAHSILVRPLGDRYQVVSGHNRLEAAKRAGLETVSAWVREMDDSTAYMELVRSNAQGELSALEKGWHALHSGMAERAYAEHSNTSNSTVHKQMAAAQVAA